MRPFSLLIIENNPKNIESLKSHLSDTGFIINVSMTGEDALHFLEKNYQEVDLVLLDVMLPQMNGFEVCKKIKESQKFKDIPVLFMTAFNTIEDKIKGFEAGAADYLLKPFIKKELIARINVHVQIKTIVEAYKNLSIMDEMTGIFNRSYAMHMLKREMLLADREQTSLLVCQVNLKKLNEINETHGYETGDEMVRAFAHLLVQSVRETDFVFRLSGSEFLLVLPKSSMENREVIIQRINDGIRKQKKSTFKLSYIYGMVEYQGRSKISRDQLLQSAKIEMSKNNKESLNE